MIGSLKIPHLICWVGMKFQTTNCDLEVSLTQNGFMKPPKKGWLLKRDLHQPGSFTPCPNFMIIMLIFVLARRTHCEECLTMDTLHHIIPC